MAEEKTRKKLSLNIKRKKVSDDTSHIKSCLERANKSAQKALFEADPKMNEINKEREMLGNQIKQMSCRIQFAASEPLQDALIELKKRDIKMLIELNNYLID